MLDDHLNPLESEFSIQYLHELPALFKLELARVPLSLGPRPEGYLNLGGGCFRKAAIFLSTSSTSGVMREFSRSHQTYP